MINSILSLADQKQSVGRGEVWWAEAWCRECNDGQGWWENTLPPTAMQSQSPKLNKKSDNMDDTRRSDCGQSMSISDYYWSSKPKEWHALTESYCGCGWRREKRGKVEKGSEGRGSKRRWCPGDGVEWRIVGLGLCFEFDWPAPALGIIWDYISRIKHREGNSFLWIMFCIISVKSWPVVLFFFFLFSRHLLPSISPQKFNNNNSNYSFSLCLFGLTLFCSQRPSDAYFEFGNPHWCKVQPRF